MNNATPELTALERRFIETMQGAPVGITIFRGENFMVEMASDKYLELVGRKLEDFVGKPLFESLPEVKSSVEPFLNAVLKTGVPYYGKEFPVTLNRYGQNDIAYFNFVYQPVKENDEQTTGIVVIASEVTELVVAKDKLAQRESHFRDLVMRSPIPMTVFKGFEHEIELANDIMFDKVWRRKREDVLGRKALDVFPELNSQKYPELLYRVMTTGVSHSEKEAIAYVQGDDMMRKMYLDFTYAPIFDANQTPYGVMITVIDVTEKVQIREQIEKAEKSARLAIESAKLGAYEIDLVTDEMSTSDRFNVIWGTQKGLTRKQYASRIHPDDIETRRIAHELSLESGVLQYEARILWSAGGSHWVKVNGTVLYDNERKPIRLIGIAQDINDEKHFYSELQRQVQERTEELQAVNEEIAATNEELSESNHLLVEANKDLEQFNYAASHDLQEPLRKIQTFINLLIDGDRIRNEDSDRDYLTKISNSATRMKSIIDDLLSYSHNTIKDHDHVTVDLNDVIKNVLEDLELVVRNKNALIELDELPKIKAIPTQMHQLFLNLISNALKFSKASISPMVNIRTRLLTNEDIVSYRNLDQQWDYFEVSVSDNGIGFSEKYAEYIFGLFKRLHTKSTYSGTGIGLTLCKKIARNHHGEIYAKSEEGVGTKMIVLLPVSVKV
ncbi:MAG: ATP-binding protein [Chryseolinea sp.]